MLRKAGILIAVVMLMAFTAGVSLASDFLTYRDAGANYFPTAAVVTSQAIGSRGNNLVDGLATGTINGAATDVFINPQGLGDALIYPYFNVRDGSVNLFTVTNTADYPVRARIRFLAGRNSIEMLDFDICLSEHDVWTSYIVNDGGTGTVKSIDIDTPIDYGQDRGAKNGVLSVAFPDGVPFRWTGTTCDTDGPNVCQDETLEGYFVVIAENALAFNSAKGTIGTNAGTDACGRKAANTGAHADLWLNDSLAVLIPGDDPLQPGGVGNVLYGTNMLISTTSSATYAYNAIALADFSDGVYLFDPTAANPNLGDASPDGLAGVEFILTKDFVMQQYYDFAGAAQTEMIVNFPTRQLHGFHTTIFSDDRVLITAWDDMENSKTIVCEFSPCPPAQSTRLPYEVNLLTVNGSKIFDSTLEVALAISDYAFGWLRVDLINALAGTPAAPAHATTVGAYTSHGLPAVGYAVSDFGNAINWMLPLIYTNLITSP